MLVVMAKTGATLKTTATPNGILDLEFAYDKEKTATVLNAWKGFLPADNILAAKVNTWLDFIFLCFYSLFLNKVCGMIAAKHKGFLFLAGKLLAAGSLTAGLLDVLENIGMLASLNGSVSNTVSLLTCIFAIAKWLLVLSAVLYISIAGCILLLKKKGSSAL